jgi:signal transduction histidine kinase
MYSGSTDGRRANDGKALTTWRHDMKNQLGIILGFADLLLQEIDTADPHRADIGEIREAAARAMELLGALKPHDEE